MQTMRTALDSSGLDITGLLVECRRGHPTARARLYDAVYGDIRRIAAKQLGRVWRRQQTLSATDLSHELYLKLAGPTGAKVQWQDRAHFFAAVAQAMRHILINRAQSNLADKRGGQWRRITMREIGVQDGQAETELLTVHEALAKLEKIDERLSDVVQMRFFGGMTAAEIGVVLDLDQRTIRRDWRKAKALLATLVER